jgi:DNA repair exonuclease SbcCD ATPase subunit
MEDVLLEFESDIADILEFFNKFRDSIGDNPVSKNTKDYIENFIKAFENYEVVLDKGNVEEIAEAILEICSSVVYLDLFVKNLDEQGKAYKNKLSKSSDALKKKIEDSSILKVTLTEKALSNVSSDIQDYRSFKKQLKDTNEKLEQLNRKVKKSLDESEIKADILTKEIESLEETYKSKVGAISLAYEEELKAINDKSAQLDSLLGNAAQAELLSQSMQTAQNKRR